MQYVLKFAVLVLFLSSCNNYKTRYPYSIADFRPEVRKLLDKIVERGSTSSYYSKQLEDICSTVELRKLFQCEHPIIRACTFPALIAKDSNNIESILFSSLDDTSIVSYNRGEFGFPRMYCADYYLYTLKYKSKIEKLKVMDSLMQSHTNLENTFIELRDFGKLPEKYYPTVKEMAIKVLSLRGLDNAAPPITADDEKEEDILVALSSYKKKEDIGFISRYLIFDKEVTWQIIQNNPDTAYFKIIDELSSRLIRLSKKPSPVNLQLVFLGVRNLAGGYPEFLKAVAKFKDKKSVNLLTEIVNRKIYPIGNVTHPEDELPDFKNELYDILLENNCAEYKHLITQLKPAALAYKRKYRVGFLDYENDTIALSNLPVQKINYW